VYAAVVAGVGVFDVTGDGIVYYRFLQRLFGEHPPHPFAYQFGCALWNAPFWLVARAGGLSGQAAVAVATHLAVGVTVVLGLVVLRRLALPSSPWLAAAVVFGSPLWYYAVFAPAYSHAVDALVTTALVWAVLARKAPVAIGGLIGAAVTVRYANAVWVLPVGALYVWRRELLAALHAAAAAAGVAFVLFMIPVVAGIPFGNPGEHDPTEPPREHLEADLDLLAPVKMLVSVHRGLFLWTPLTLLGVVGFVLLLRRRRDPELLVVGAGALLLLLAHVAWGRWWDGGFSFSARFLTSLFALFLIGFAELVRRVGPAVWAVAAVCIAWSLFLGANHHYGFEGVNRSSSVIDVARGRSPSYAVRNVLAHVRDRFR
jgi:hypothetical protein